MFRQTLSISPSTPTNYENQNQANHSLESSYSFINEKIFDFAYPIASWLLTDVLYERAVSSGENIAQTGFTGSWGFLNCFIPEQFRLAVVTGERSNLMSVANYGNDISEETRKTYDFLTKLTPNKIKTAVNLVGANAEKMVAPLRRALNKNPTGVFDNTVEQFMHTMEDWDNSHSFEDNIALHASRALFKAVFGIEEVAMEHALLARKIGKFVINPNIYSRRLIDLQNDIESGIEKLNAANANKNNPDHLEKDSELEQAVYGNHHFVLLGGNNLGTLVGAGVRLIHTDENVKEELIKRFPIGSSPSVEDLENDEYLDSLYREMIRINGTPVIARYVPDEGATLKIKNSNGKYVQQEIAPNTTVNYLMRKTQHDSRFFRAPIEVLPKRFMTENTEDVKNEKNNTASNKEIEIMLKFLGPFSMGFRSCPAAIKFTPVMAKSSWIKSLEYDFKFPLDAKIQPMRPNRIDDEWKQDVFLTEIPKPIETQSVILRR